MENDIKNDEVSEALVLTNVAKDIVPTEFVNKYKEMLKLQAELKNIEASVKASLISMFEGIPDLNTSSVEVDGLRFTYTKPFIRKTVDSKLLQEEYPEIYAKVVKDTNVKSSIKTTVQY